MGIVQEEEAAIVAVLVETITAIRATLEAAIVEEEAEAVIVDEVKAVIVVVAFLHGQHILSNPVIELIL
jgi:hypothetical protein